MTVWSQLCANMIPQDLNRLKNLVGRQPVRRNKHLMKELSCLREMLDTFREQNDDSVQKEMESLEQHQRILSTQVRERRIQECVTGLSELSTIAFRRGIPLSALLPVAERQLLNYLLDRHMENSMGESSSRSGSSRPQSAASSTRPSTSNAPMEGGTLSLSGGLSTNDDAPLLKKDTLGLTASSMFSKRAVTPTGVVKTDDPEINDEEIRVLASDVRQALKDEEKELLDGIADANRALEAENDFRTDRMSTLKKSITCLTDLKTEDFKTFAEKLHDRIRLEKLETESKERSSVTSSMKDRVSLTRSLGSSGMISGNTSLGSNPSTSLANNPDVLCPDFGTRRPVHRLRSLVAGFRQPISPLAMSPKASGSTGKPLISPKKNAKFYSAKKPLDNEPPPLWTFNTATEQLPGIGFDPQSANQQPPGFEKHPTQSPTLTKDSFKERLFPGADQYASGIPQKLSVSTPLDSSLHANSTLGRPWKGFDLDDIDDPSPVKTSVTDDKKVTETLTNMLNLEPELGDIFF